MDGQQVTYTYKDNLCIKHYFLKFIFFSVDGECPPMKAALDDHELDTDSHLEVRKFGPTAIPKSAKRKLKTLQNIDQGKSYAHVHKQ